MRQIAIIITLLVCWFSTTAQSRVLRTTLQTYSNSSYYNQGLLQTEEQRDSVGALIGATEHRYNFLPIADSVYYPQLVQTRQRQYENGVAMETQQTFAYDGFGNVTQYTDWGNGSTADQIIVNSSYYHNNNPYLHNRAQNTKVTTAAGIQRQRSQTIDAQGNITSITQQIDAQKAATYTFIYDSYGNLQQAIQPTNYKGQQMWHRYRYDAETQSLITQVTDAYGSVSRTQYDPRFQAPVQTISSNGDTMLYSYDAVGRIQSVTGPYELAAHKDYTLRFDYHPEATVPYATTDHYDPTNGGNWRTTTFTDGLGRVLQTQQPATVFDTTTKTDNDLVVCSGKTIYNHWQQPQTQYYPTTQAAANNNYNSNAGLLLQSLQYDARGRLQQTTLADGATATIRYQVQNNTIRTTATDALQHHTLSTHDVRGRLLNNTRYNAGQAITTAYQYDPIGQLLQVIDCKLPQKLDQIYPL